MVMVDDAMTPLNEERSEKIIFRDRAKIFDVVMIIFFFIITSVLLLLQFFGVVYLAIYQ